MAGSIHPSAMASKGPLLMASNLSTEILRNATSGSAECAASSFAIFTLLLPCPRATAIHRGHRSG